MKKIRAGSAKAFTLPELLVSMLLVIVVIGVGYSFLVMAKDAYRYSFEQSAMQAKAIFILERILHGTDTTRKGIAEAQSITTPAPGGSMPVITFVDQDNALLARTFLHNIPASEVNYVDENGINSRLDVDAQVDNDVQALLFTRTAGSGNMIQVDLILQRTILGKVMRLELSTSVIVRNI